MCKENNIKNVVASVYPEFGGTYSRTGRPTLHSVVLKVLTVCARSCSTLHRGLIVGLSAANCFRKTGIIPVIRDI